MADRVVEEEILGVPEIDETLQDIMMKMIDEAVEHLTEEQGFAPFTALLNGEVLSVDIHEGEDVDDCFNKAEACVSAADGSRAYAFCYDGYLETDKGQKDAIICEGGLPGQEEGVALALMYSMPECCHDDEDECEGEAPEFGEDILYIGPCPNFLRYAEPVVDEPQDDSDDLIG